MSFASSVKSEICKSYLRTDATRQALLCGILYTSAKISLSGQGPSIVIHTAHKKTAECVMARRTPPPKEQERRCSTPYLKHAGKFVYLPHYNTTLFIEIVIYATDLQIIILQGNTQ